MSRLTVQKGFDLLFDSLPEIARARASCACVVLGSGEARYESFFDGLQQRFPDRVVFHRGYSEELAHLIEAASDMFLMPSLYEPCGLNQMYSLKYGTVPIVRRTGGLADSVQHVESGDAAGHRHRVQRLRCAGGALGDARGAGSVQGSRRLAAAHAQWHGAGFLVGPAEPAST